MPTETRYWRAKEVEGIAERLITQHHEDLEGVPIKYVFRRPAAVSRGRVVYGKARRIGGLAAHLVALVGRDEVAGPVAFFVVEIAADPWFTLNEKQRAALVDHELSHLELVQDDDGTRLALRGHDLEEFVAVVGRHGLWRPAVEEFAAAAIGAQLSLELTDTGPEVRG